MDSASLLASEDLALRSSSEKSSENCSKSNRTVLSFSTVKTDGSCGGKTKLIWRFRRSGSEITSPETVQQSASPPIQRQSSVDSTESRPVSKTQTKRRLTFALSEEEIAADILAISGGEQPKVLEQSSPVPDPEPQRPKRSEKANKNQRKPRFSFALSLEEIRADILAVTGKEPVIPIKKRAKRIPKEIENLFPSFRGFN